MSWASERVIDCCLMVIDKFLSYIMWHEQVTVDEKILMPALY